MKPTVDIVTPSEDEKKETGEMKPCDVQRDEETGAILVKVWGCCFSVIDRYS